MSGGDLVFFRVLREDSENYLSLNGLGWVLVYFDARLEVGDLILRL